MKILLLQLKRIGDLVLTTPAIAAVREKFADAQITLVVAPGCAELLPAVRGVDRALIAGDSATWLEIVRQRYDYCVDFTHRDRSALLTVLSKARKRVTWSHARVQSKLRALAYNELIDCSLRDTHTVDYQLALLAPLGIRDASPQLRLDLPASAHEQAQRILTREKIASEFVIVHPGAARIEKFWEPARWAAVIDFAAARQLPAWSPAARPRSSGNISPAISRHAGAPFTDLSGKIDLLTFAALIQRARVVATVDSAPMHLAAALQTPQVALFGLTNPFHWRPRATPAVILQAGNAAPLTEFSPEQELMALTHISTEQVINAMETLLAAPRATAS
jgi:predicted lipopolysaccharide heptosyltransferase III